MLYLLPHLLLFNPSSCVRASWLWTSTKQHFSRWMICSWIWCLSIIHASSTTTMGQAAYVSLLTWRAEPLPPLSHSLTDDKVRRIYAVFHWLMWIHETSHLWTSSRCHIQCNLADHDWRNKTSVSELCFGLLCYASGTLLTIWCASPQPLGICIPWKGPQNLHAIGSMDLLYTHKDGVVPLLVHVDLPDSVLISSLDLFSGHHSGLNTGSNTGTSTVSFSGSLLNISTFAMLVPGLYTSS